MTVLKHYKTVTACGDIMFINGIPFFVTISRNLKFRTVEALAGTKTKQIMMAIKNVLPLVRNTCNSFDDIKNLHRGIPKPKKTTQAPLVYINAHSCVYNKCLIVISRRDMIERRGSQKKVRFGVPV